MVGVCPPKDILGIARVARIRRQEWAMSSGRSGEDRRLLSRVLLTEVFSSRRVRVGFANCELRLLEKLFGCRQAGSPPRSFLGTYRYPSLPNRRTLHEMGCRTAPEGLASRRQE